MVGCSESNGEICSYVLSQHKKGIENKLRNQLKSERVRLEEVIECNPDENNIQALRIINSRERELEMKSIEGHRIRATVLDKIF